MVKDEINLIKSDIGHDPVSGQNICIFTPEIDTQYYNEDLRDLERQLNSGKSWAYIVVDDCLHIGLYKDNWRVIGKKVLEVIAHHQKIEHKMIVDARLVMKDMGEPLLFLPFSKRLIIDILMGKVFMFLMLDVDNFLKLFEYFGSICTWTSRKEATRIKESVRNINFYMADHRLVKFKNAHGEECIMTMGILSKIFFMHIRPNYIALSSNFIKKDKIHE